MTTELVKIIINGLGTWFQVQSIIGNTVTAAKLLNPKIKQQFKTSEVVAHTDDPRIINQISGISGLGSLESPYVPAAESCTILDTIVPDSMDYEMHIAARKIRAAVGGNFTEFVREKLGYTHAELCEALAAEQIDAVAMAIYNIEKGEGIIVGDQTGIGKGRIAAAMIRYACRLGKQPIFISEKPNLFSDIYRDLVDIGSADLVPFIVNSKESKTDVKDVNGNVIYTAPAITEQNRIFLDKRVPRTYDYVMSTYSQFNSPEKKNVKPDFLKAVALDNIVIMDEAHNASGSSNTGEFLQNVVKNTMGVVFLSATFAKRPDNMPIYALRTAMRDANMSAEDLIEAIKSGGVALQEVLSSQLVAEGQMIRRERSFDGIRVSYNVLTDLEQEHKAISDNITEIIREIIGFQENHIEDRVKEMDEIAAAEGKEAMERQGTSKAGVDNSPYFSKVFNVINQMLFSIKADAVADKAIEILKEGKKPVIAFASTMGSFIESMENERGEPVANGDTINADFKTVLMRGLDGVMRYTVKDEAGKPTYETFKLENLSPEGQEDYLRIKSKIDNAVTGITISPIDKIIQKIQEAGYSVAEVTGRKYEVQFNSDKPDSSIGVVLARKRMNTNDAFRQFNNNEVDVLMINQAGSTGASAHAIKTDKVPADQVKPRVMIILQAELNINTEVQKRGRINRTGQLMKPEYDYVTSAVPAEKRLMMMLQKKLKSLDANTTSNQKNSEKSLSVDDFLNKYGDRIVHEYLVENPLLNKKLGDPLGADDEDKEKEDIKENFAHKVSGRVAVLSCEEQESFYKEIITRYNDYVEYLKQAGEYDLEIETVNLEAETISAETVKVGKGGSSAFGTDSILEKCKVNILKKPFSKVELDNILKESLGDLYPKAHQEQLRKRHEEVTRFRLEQELMELDEKYERLTDNITNEKKYQKLKSEREKQEYLAKRIEDLAEAKEQAKEMTKEDYSNKYEFLDGIFKFFTIGQAVRYPEASFSAGTTVAVPGIFLGFAIDQSRPNPYVPSAVKLRFAIANSIKYIALPCSGEQGRKILAIQGMTSYYRYDYYQNWDQYTKESNTNRGFRHIVTGNLLQAFSNYKGKLISFTTLDGSVRKGILLPENWQQKENTGSEKVIVPIAKAKNVIMSLTTGSTISLSNGMSITRYYGNEFRVVVPKSKAYHGIYLSPDIRKLLTNPSEGFQMISGNMVGYVEVQNMPELIRILQEQFSLSVSIHRAVYDTMAPKNEDVQSKDESTAAAEEAFRREKELHEERIRKNEKQTLSTGSNNDKAKAIARLKLLALKIKMLSIPQYSY